MSHDHIIFAAQPAQHAFQQPSNVASILFASASSLFMVVSPLVQVWEVGLAFIFDKIASIGVVMFTVLPSKLKEQKCTK